MEVGSISGNQPNFKGYISKPLVKYVNSAVINEVNSLVENANKQKVQVNCDDIQKISNFGKNILNIFSDYLSMLSKNTSLTIDQSLLKFENPISKSRSINLYEDSYIHSAVINNSHIHIPSGSRKILKDKENSGLYDLETLKIIAESLENIDPRDIDKLFIDGANLLIKDEASKSVGFLKKFRLRNWARQIDNFAKSLDVYSRTKTKLEVYLRNAARNKILVDGVEKEQRHLEKENERIAKLMLKG